MAVLEVLKYPDPRLREIAEPVTEFDAHLQALVEDMAETMYAENGCGLAATQVGVRRRIFVIDVAGEDQPSELRVFINPEIATTKGVVMWEEGCLSFPGASEEVKRAEQVTVRALDVRGQPFELAADGLLAVAIQHENDHLNGVLFIDKLSALKKRMVSRKVSRRLQEDSVGPPGNEG
jgi:peptide deformylase